MVGFQTFSLFTPFFVEMIPFNLSEQIFFQKMGGSEKKTTQLVSGDPHIDMFTRLSDWKWS